MQHFSSLQEFICVTDGATNSVPRVALELTAARARAQSWWLGGSTSDL